MIPAIQNIITSPAIYNLSQNTVSQVSTETALKAIGHPAFVLANNKIDSSTKKFSATKELLYQIACLGIYMALIIPVFRKGTFNFAKKLYKDEPIFKAFKNAKEFSQFYKMNDAERAAKLVELNKNAKNGDVFTKENMDVDFAKGANELGAMTGSVIGLAILAPIISHPLIRPIMKSFGMISKENKVSLQDNNK